MKNKLMIDLETTGTRPGCRVLSIGAFGFGKDGQQVQFYRRLRIAEQAYNGLVDEPATLKWWGEKAADVRDEAFSGQDDTNVAIAEFKHFFYKNFDIGKDKNFQAWSCGIDFDFPILQHLFFIYGHKMLPWFFYTQRDYRTIRDTFPGIIAAEATNEQTKHSAIEDAKAQMRGLRKFYEDHPEAI